VILKIILAVIVYRTLSWSIGLNHLHPNNLPETNDFVKKGAITTREFKKDIIYPDNERSLPLKEQSLLSLSSSLFSNYPLSSLNLTSADRSYMNGFSQRVRPVPLQRWKAFSNQFCIDDPQNWTSQLVRTTAMSEDGDKKFHRRVPFALIVGTQKGGTTALYEKLGRHTNIQKLNKKELAFFDSFLDEDADIIRSDGGIFPGAALQAYHEKKVGKIIPLRFLQVSTQLNIVDATPSYFFLSDRVPARVFCVCPWVKILILLRNPVDRAFSQYNMQYEGDTTRKTKKSKQITFEEYVEMDWQVLKDIGVIPPSRLGATEIEDDWMGSKEQLDAWGKYAKLGLNSPIGRGMYAIQLHQWLRAMKSAGKNPLTDLFVVQSERFQNDSHSIYLDVLRFLQLPTHSIMKERNSRVNSATNTNKMNETTKRHLEELFRPYNRQLEKLLGSKWKGVWE
jgi:hypothetical protein